MWVANSSDYECVKAAELSLLSSAVRGDAAQLVQLLASDFAEVGRSGQRWTRAEIIEQLQSEEPRDAPSTSDWIFNRVSADLVLVQYRIHGGGGDSRHTSLWEITGPVLRFHQGTLVAITS